MSPTAINNMVGDAEKDPMLAELGATKRADTSEKKRRNPFILPLLLLLLGPLFLLTTLRSTCWWSPDITTILTSPIDAPDPGLGPGPVFIPNGIRPAVISRSPQTDAVPAPTSSAPTPQRTVLQCFEVDQPVLLPDGPAESDGSSHEGKTWDDENACTVLLMRRDFAWSYEDPFIGDYTPPPCAFNRVVLNFTSVSHGRQYDRLAVMYLSNTEIWRTSTAQPTTPPGIRWTYLKDATAYLSLFRTPQRLTFDLGNLVNDQFTGIFNTTLTATFFLSPSPAPKPADLIIPLTPNVTPPRPFHLPRDGRALVSIPPSVFPRHATRAVISLSATGQASEEFWWSNVPSSAAATFNSTAGMLPGQSPFREVQVLVDGILAGVAWPFPVIFTGGVSPGLHRPVVSVEAFEMREREVDVTAFLPMLCDGAGGHKVEMNDIMTVGRDVVQGGREGVVAYKYPLFANSTYEVGPLGNLSIWAHVLQGKEYEVSGAGSVFPDGLEAFGGGEKYTGSVLKTVKEGEAGFYQSGDGKNASGWGTARQIFRFGGLSREGMMGDDEVLLLYEREVEAANGSVLHDSRKTVGAADREMSGPAPGGKADLAVNQFAVVQGHEEGGRAGPRVFMGRNQGLEAQGLRA
ncbi:peptide N-acetyl-beta-D-glucosaminyl asparaginase amidase A-domain-containing protein [Schizothecium vesticola]|uniref:Peptide N-acetyl-beta-D-glucosaminyl asparaginase amidase A-domain-containing protein n=1 Tax=Schizothecium vesticola TaxID=314040 RepID=A0AA40K086_9PEZI|nr:peptide N-acetyl-beta-D-glucosaminyl asparaginase amidase A-domain-containing protein [Schizothecium vesticola]